MVQRNCGGTSNKKYYTNEKYTAQMQLVHLNLEQKLKEKLRGLQFRAHCFWVH